MMDLTSLNGENASRPIGGRSAPPHVRRVWFAVLSLRNDVGSQVAAVRPLPSESCRRSPRSPTMPARKGGHLPPFPSSARTCKDEAEGVLLRLLPSFERKFHRRLGCVVREIEAPLRER